MSLSRSWESSESPECQKLKITPVSLLDLDLDRPPTPGPLQFTSFHSGFSSQSLHTPVDLQHRRSVRACFRLTACREEMTRSYNKRFAAATRVWVRADQTDFLIQRDNVVINALSTVVSFPPSHTHKKAHNPESGMRAALPHSHTSAVKLPWCDSGSSPSTTLTPLTISFI